ncbi:hypothetical protein OE88DRAFT_1652378 [Heliocybe sulcata]|uniref:CcmS related domain-containing protein n=1 Tax=Heliocybe sulcata TaxID=5364 RepID=A0A5C3NEW9_9AGAM|nr:hypothetical protein OE88DRAFT_1652378 [Heliocybe sulcata]
MYSRDRKAKDRIFWVFSPHKDERVASALGYIEAMSADIATFGLQKFFETRERGALFTNAGFRTGDSPPVFDWMTFDQLQATRDQTIETSVAYYDPAVHVIVFVFLLSRSGNSMAIWRRKLNVPNNLRLRYIHEIQLAKSALRNDYEIHVDELPYDEEPMEMPPEEPPPPPPKKKRGFWRRLKFW